MMTPDDVKYLKEPLEPTLEQKKSKLSRKIKVGIIGAGVSGLYAALMLESLGIDFEIHEANTEQLGGRAFTYYFNKNYKKPAKKCGEYYDYVEMGPMRIPRKKTRLVGNESWSLINYLNARKSVQPKVKPIPFIYSNDNTLYYYNGRKIFYSNPQVNDPLGFGNSANGGSNTGVPDSYTSRAYWEWLDLVMSPFLKLMDTNNPLAYTFLKKYDNHSMRSFMATFDAKNLLNETGLLTSDYVSFTDPNTGLRLDREFPQMGKNFPKNTFKHFKLKILILNEYKINFHFLKFFQNLS